MEEREEKVPKERGCRVCVSHQKLRTEKRRRQLRSRRTNKEGKRGRDRETENRVGNSEPYEDPNGRKVSNHHTKESVWTRDESRKLKNPDTVEKGETGDLRSRLIVGPDLVTTVSV